MVEEQRVAELEGHVVNLRIDQGKLESKLDTALTTLSALNVSVQNLTNVMNRTAGERTGAKAAFGVIGAVLGAIGAMVVEWFAQHK